MGLKQCLEGMACIVLVFFLATKKKKNLCLNLVEGPTKLIVSLGDYGGLECVLSHSGACVYQITWYNLLVFFTLFKIL